MIARSLALGFAATLAAQTPPGQQPADATTPRPAATVADAAGKAKLKQALSTTAQLPSCAFTAVWGPVDKNNAGNNPFAMLGGGPGVASGLWHGELLQLAFDDDELLCQGRRTIAKNKDDGWVARAGRFADGNKIPFLPEPAQLLATLAAMDLAVTHREAGSLEDRPVEIATVELTEDQYADLVWSSLLPEASAFGGRMIFGQLAGNGGARPAMPKPEATVDLACHFDPATGLLRRLHVRTYRKRDAQGQVFVVGGGAGRVRVNAGGAGGNDDEDAEDEPAAPPQAGAANAPLPQWQDGLPVRPKKKLQVDYFVLDFNQHGAAKLPELDAIAKQLLGR